jgi:putative SOS response-associated peptidase YedK
MSGWMCNLYTQTKSVDEVARVFRDLQMPLGFPDGVPNLQPGEIRITDPGPIVRAGGNGFELVLRRWSWPGPTGKPVYNFRSEGREFESGRCLIVADGFFEFTPQEDPKAKRKHKWLFTLRDQPLFAIAGLWRTDPKIGEAFTMLTTEPGEDVRPYHNRQIVVLPPAEFGRWLDPNVAAHEVLRPLPEGSLAVEQIC